MSGLRRPQYAALAVAATVGIAYLAYCNYQQALLKSAGAGLHRSNAVRRPPRRRRERNLDDPSIDSALSHIQDALLSSRVVGRYQNDVLFPYIENLDQLNLDLCYANVANIHADLIERCRNWPHGWSREAQMALRDHVLSQYVQYIVKELCTGGSHVNENVVPAICSAFEDIGISRRVVRHAISLVNDGSEVNT